MRKQKSLSPVSGMIEAMTRGRPRKIDDSVQRSFRLPARLLAQLQEAARQRGVEVADVVRDLLARHAADYLREGRRPRYDQHRALVARVREDKKLAPIFEKNLRRRAALTLPTDLGAEAMALVCRAVEAYRELEQAGEPTDERGALLGRLVEAAWGAFRERANVTRAMILCAVGHRPMAEGELLPLLEEARARFQKELDRETDRALTDLVNEGTLEDVGDPADRRFRLPSPGVSATRAKSE
jgi:hypothetical protein